MLKTVQTKPKCCYMSLPTVTTIDPSNKAALQRFISLERKLMKPFPLYISEIDADVVKLLTRRSAMFKEMELALFIASKEGADVARCAAIINRRYQAEKQAGAGFIGFFAAAEDCGTEVAEMIQCAEKWLKEKGVTKVIAPVNGGAPQNMGFLAAAFDKDPMFPAPWHPSYYQAYIESWGYQPTYPLWFYEIDFACEKYREARQRYANHATVTIRPISKKNWNRDIEILTSLLNETFVNEWEFTTLDNVVAKEFFGPMKPILDAHQIQFAEVDGKPVGFCFALPDLTPLFRGFNGSVGLPAIFKLLFRAKKFQRAGILGIGVTEAYRGKGVSKALAMQVYGYHEKLGLKSSLYYPVNESNKESRGFAESIGGKGQAMYVVYDKVLS